MHLVKSKGSLSMISRRLLRVKILQVLYAQQSKQDHTVQKSEKELFFSINKAYDLYHLFLLIPVELVKTEEQRIDNAKTKLRPDTEDLNPNTRFADNRVVAQLRNNWQLGHYVSENKTNWSSAPELFKNLLQEIREKDYYIQYMNKKIHTYEDDKNLIIKILSEEIPAFIELGNTLEELSIFWNDDAEFILSMVVKTLKTFRETDTAQKRLMPLYKNEEDEDFAKKLLRRALLNHEEYNELIKKHAQNWEFERIALMDILIMHMALAEIIEFNSIPVKVSLNEYIDIAKDYSTPNSSTFINGILDNAVKELTATKKIVKIGRGLIEN